MEGEPSKKCERDLKISLAIFSWSHGYQNPFFTQYVSKQPLTVTMPEMNWEHKLYTKLLKLKIPDQIPV